MQGMRPAAAAALVLGLALTACASESHRTVETRAPESHGTPYSGPRHPLALGSFQNRSPYLQGVFSGGQDPLGSQARTILQTHLAETGRFDVLDRGNMEQIAREAQLAGTEQRIEGARYVVAGEVTEFGRKNTGDQVLFGIGGRGAEQVAYAKVAINIVDVATSRVVYTSQGAGEYALSSREILGTGGSAGYDSTLNGKVLDLAITDAVNRLVTGLEHGEWSVAGAR
jgi:curli biogenesis system outer membrane secretion channel CsgG